MEMEMNKRSVGHIKPSKFKVQGSKLKSRFWIKTKIDTGCSILKLIIRHGFSSLSAFHSEIRNQQSAMENSGI
jgi:hypothetical protein